MASEQEPVVIQQPTVLIGSSDPEAPCICFIGMVEHPFDVAGAAKGLSCNVISVPVGRWDDALTPWPARGLYPGDADFKGLADTTLDLLLNQILPKTVDTNGLSPRAWAIAGYSLGGLFSLHAFLKEPLFQAVASMSGSVWYEGWTDRLENTMFDSEGRFVYLSLGEGEKRAPQKILKSVEDDTARAAQILEARGCTVTFQTSTGGHFDHIPERLHAGLTAIDGFLCGMHRG